MFLSSSWVLLSCVILFWPFVVSFHLSYLAQHHQFRGLQRLPSFGLHGLSFRISLHSRFFLRPSAPFFFPRSPSGLRGPFFFVTSLWPLRLRATSSWPFVTSSRVRFFFASLWSLQSFFFGTSLWSWRPCVTFSWTFVAPSWPHVALAVCMSEFSRARHPGAGSFSPHFIDLVLRWTPTRVLRPFPVNCSSSHDATAQPYRSLYFGNVRSFAAANLHFSPRNISPPWAHAGYSCLRYPWSFRFYSARYL